MPAIDLNDLLGKMLQAAAAKAREKWPSIRDEVESELTELASIAVEIEKKKLEGEIDEHAAQALLDMQKTALETVLSGIAGQTKLLAEAAVNAAIDVARQAIKTATGFSLL
jgi:hypothetical protein